MYLLKDLLPLFSLFCLCSQFNFCLGYFPPERLDGQIQQQRQCTSMLSNTYVPLLIPNDQHGNVNYDIIPTYLDYLKNAGVPGVILFTLKTDGLLRTQEEKMLLISSFAKEAIRCNIRLGVQVGGTDYNDTLALARYAKKAGAIAVLSGPELYYKAPTSQDVVEYLQPIAKACYPLNFYFSDLAFDSGLDYNTIGIVRILKKKVRNFGGVLTNLVTALKTVAVLGNSDIFVYSADSMNQISPYIFCLNGTSTLIANVFATSLVRLQRAALAGDFPLATAIAKNINNVYYGCIATEKAQRIDLTLLGYKIQIIRLLMWIVNGIDLGNAPTPPLPKLTVEQEMRCYRICQREGVAYRNPRDRGVYKYLNVNYDNEYSNGECDSDSNVYDYDDA